MSKIEACEDTHQSMLKDHLMKRGVNVENYYRYNVEVGVGDFGMNEWNRMADISTNTRRYVKKPEVQNSMEEAAAKIGKIHRAKIRHGSHVIGGELDGGSWEQLPGETDSSNILAVELPGSEVPQVPVSQQQRPQYPQQYQMRLNSPEDKFTVVSSDEFPQPVDAAPSRRSNDPSPNRRESLQVTRPPYPENDGNDYPTPPRRSAENSPRRSNDGPDQSRPVPPPLPPKTPLPHLGEQEARRTRPSQGLPPMTRLPYPENDGPPPVVNLARKPEYGGR